MDATSPDEEMFEILLRLDSGATIRPSALGIGWVSQAMSSQKYIAKSAVHRLLRAGLATSKQDTVGTYLAITPSGTQSILDRGLVPDHKHIG